MDQKTVLMALITETSLHAGAGASLGVVDLPIQREGHNGWPCVFGSAVKGALRDRASQDCGAVPTAQEAIYEVFGPNVDNAADNAGALAVGDARLLLLPVRSLTSAFKWVTCPEALQRLKRDSKRLGLDLKLPAIPKVAAAQALTAEASGDLFLEEYSFTQQPDAAVQQLATALATMLPRDAIEDDLNKRLVLISDDMFSLLTTMATPVNAHIALNSATKTTRTGALWYEETLPPETVLYVPLVANKSRRKESTMGADAIMQTLTALFSAKPWLQLGGNETVGMGWCAVKFVDKEHPADAN